MSMSSNRHIPALAALLALPLLAGCATTTLPLVPIPVPIPRIAFLGGDDLDFSRKDWAEAGGKLIEKMRQEYPHTERKGIDWDTAGAALQEKLAAAEATEDAVAYHAALRGFAESLHDGNVSLRGDEKQLEASFRGGFGLELAQLADGRVLVAAITEDGPAEKSRVSLGAEVLGWNGVPIATALAAVPMLWAGNPPATTLAQHHARLAGITRAAIDDKAMLGLRDAEGKEYIANLTATEQPWAPLDAGGLLSGIDLETGSILEFEVLDESVGYIDIVQLAPTLTAPFPSRAFRHALGSLVESEANGIIVDLRGDSAGLDEFAAEFASHFMADAVPYRSLAVYVKKSKTFEIEESTALEISPQPEQVSIPVVLLVDESTSRAPELLAATLQRNGRAKVMGPASTAGVPLVPERTVTLPEGYTFSYPIARWLGPDGESPVEPDATGAGGVTPDVPVVFTPENLASDGDPVLDQARALFISK
jgi:C-terminal processing protease CtpA/Prc